MSESSGPLSEDVKPLRVADGHSDLLQSLAYCRFEPNPFAIRWLDQLRAGSVRLQVCSLFAGLDRQPDGALRAALDQVAACRRAQRQNPDVLTLVRSRHDLAELIHAPERIGLLLSIEGAEPLGYSPELTDVFWALGVRMVGLTWNRRNPFADGAAEDPTSGLSRLGRELVRTLVNLGAIIDLAHASERTFWDVYDLTAESTTPLVVSHGACRALEKTTRNLSDEQLRALAGRGGLLGIMAHPVAISPRAPTVERLVDHIEHAVGVMGPRHVGMGADFIEQIMREGGGSSPDPPDLLLPDGASLSQTIEGFSGPAHYPVLAKELAHRRLGAEEIDALLFGNMIDLFERALPAGPAPT